MPKSELSQRNKQQLFVFMRILFVGLAASSLFIKEGKKLELCEFNIFDVLIEDSFMKCYFKFNSMNCLKKGESEILKLNCDS